MRKAITLATSALLLCACSGPVGPIAGGELGGESADWPTDWTFTQDSENILLQTNSADPYSVTLWAVDVDNILYVTAVNPESQWVQNLTQDAHVVIGVAGKLYQGRAHRVMDNDEIARVGERYSEKYEMTPEEGANIIEEGGIIYRFAPR